MMHITLPSLLYSAPGAVPEALRTPERRQQLVLMRDAGIHTMEIAWGLQHGWSEDGRFDFATLDEGLAEMAAMAPEIRLLLRVDTRAPDWWGARWPEELVGYALSPTHASTETSDMAADAGPRRVSLAAPRWRRAAAAGLRALVRHVRGSASGRRVLGLMSACGTFGEWHYWGFLHLPDTGPAMTAHFRRWAARRYRTPEAAGAAWGMPIAGWGDVRVPGLERIANEASAFRAGSYAAWTLDYVRCHQALAADTLLHFCRTVKQASAGELLAGAFYGYLFHTPWRDEGGHLEYARVVRSRWVDYLSGPQIYELRARDLGGSGLDRGLIADVLRHGKLWFSEADTPTHIGRRMAYFWRTPEEIARNAADSIALIRRDAARAFTQGNQLWWFDFGRNYTGGEYLDDEIMAEIAQLARLDGEMARLDRTPVAQVAVVYHPASLYHMAHWRAGRDGVSGGVTDGLVHQAQYLGAPAEVLQAEGVTARHRLVIVANAFYLSPGERTRLHRRLCRDDRTVVWLYASGALGSDAPAAGVSATTGLRTAELPEAMEPVIRFGDSAWLPEALRGAVYRYQPTAVWMEAHDPLPAPERLQPAFAVEDDGAEPLAWWPDGRVAVAAKRARWGLSVFSALPALPGAFFRHLLVQAGGHVYCQHEDVWLANRSVLAVHTRDGGPRRVALPERADVVEAHTGQVIARNALGFEVVLPERSTTLWVLRRR